MELTDREKAMDRSDRRWRNVLVAIAVVIVGGSVVNVGCCIDTLDQPTADVMKRTIEDPDWDSVLSWGIEDPDWDAVR